jgi:hypothetical protein
LSQERELCDTDGDYEPASETLRTLELRDFGIAVGIPSNYRAMKLQNGDVDILHPDDYEMLQCVARGGAGARGYYSETIRLVAPDPTMSLRDQAIWAVGYGVEADGSRVPAYTQIIEYNQNGLSGYVVESLSEYGATFLGTYPGGQKLLEVTAGCDCPVEIEDVTRLLSNVTPLD